MTDRHDGGPATAPRLWEVDHPYYMNEGNYYQSGCHQVYESLDDFIDEWGGMDIDTNRVHRWDWREGEDWGVEVDESEDVLGLLMVYFIMQRKARTLSCEISVRRSDERRVIEYLRKHAERTVEIWSPFLSIAARSEAK